MLGLKLRAEFRGRRLRGTAIELTNANKTGATQIPAAKFLEKKGEGVFGVAWKVKDIDEVYQVPFLFLYCYPLPLSLLNKRV